MLDLYKTSMYTSDLNSKDASLSFRIYPLLVVAEPYGSASYLKNFKSLNILRTLAQLRLQNIYINSLLIDKHIFSFNPTDVCTKCALQAPEDSQHVLYICPSFNDIREKFFSITDRDYDLYFWAGILNSDEKPIIVKFINMVNAILARK